MNATTQFRLLVLKITALVATLIAGGCNMPSSVVPQPGKPIEPQTVQLKITVDGEGKVSVGGGADVSVTSASNGSVSAERCGCGCGKDGCQCQSDRTTAAPTAGSLSAGSGPQLVTALKDSKLVVEMLTDFDAGQCAACDLAWNDWLANGKDWPFVLVKRRGAGGKTSPTFVMPGGKAWSPSSYSTGMLADYWRKQQ